MDDWTVEIDNAKRNFNAVGEAGVWNKLSIYRVPAYMMTTEDNGAAYKPQVVSLGPLHHGEDCLKLMEEAKTRALVHLLRDTDKSVADFMHPLRAILPDLMDSYEQLDERWRENGREFLRMMVLDGCFVMEILRKNFLQYATCDPVFSKQRQPTVIEYIRRDMLLIENQLPLQVLVELAAVVGTGAQATVDQSNITYLLLDFCFPDKGATFNGGTHMLDLARQSMLQNPTTGQVQGPTNTSQSRWYAQCLENLHQTWINARRSMNESWLVMELHQARINIFDHEVIRRSAVELHQAWIRLKEITKNSWSSTVLPKAEVNAEKTTNNSRSVKEMHQVGITFERSETRSLKDITFKKGILHLPTITIELNSETMFLNFIAFEQLHMEEGRFMSSYFLFMAGLLTTPEDVRLLRENQIVESSVASDTDIVEIIKKLVKGLTFSKNDSLYQLRQELNSYYIESERMCRTRVDRWYLKLCDTYFESPWSIIKLIAGSVIIAATVVSACYTVLQYYKK